MAQWYLNSEIRCGANNCLCTFLSNSMSQGKPRWHTHILLHPSPPPVPTSPTQLAHPEGPPCLQHLVFLKPPTLHLLVPIKFYLIQFFPLDTPISGMKLETAGGARQHAYPRLYMFFTLTLSPLLMNYVCAIMLYQVHCFLSLSTTSIQVCLCCKLQNVVTSNQRRSKAKLPAHSM